MHAHTQLNSQGSGVLVYLRGQQGRGHGLVSELQSYPPSEEAAELCSPTGLTLQDAASPVSVSACSTCHECEAARQNPCMHAWWHHIPAASEAIWTLAWVRAVTMIFKLTAA
jgi:hypothetical protein